MNILRKYGEKLDYDIFMICLLVLTLMRYAGLINISYFVLVSLLSIFVVLSGKSLLYLLSIGGCSLMSFSEGMDFVHISKIYALILAILLVIDFFLNRSYRGLGKLTKPLFLLVFVTLISYFASMDVTFAIYSILITVAYLIGYLYLYNALEKEDGRLAIKMTLYFAVLVTLELLFVIITNAEARTLLTTDRYHFPSGWENLNIVVYGNLVAIPFAMYNLYKNKFHWKDVLILIVVTLGPVVTLSRSTWLVVAVYYGLGVLYLLSKKFNIKKAIIYSGIAGVSVLLIIVILQLSGVIHIPERFTTGLLFLDDRVEVYQTGIDAFLSSPIIGTGGIYTSRYYLSENGLVWFNYHNTILQVGTLGIIGAFVFGYLFYMKYKIVTESTSAIKWIVTVMILVCTFINGMLQPMYFNMNFMAYMFIFIVVVELEHKKSTQN